MSVPARVQTGNLFTKPFCLLCVWLVLGCDSRQASDATNRPPTPPGSRETSPIQVASPQTVSANSHRPNFVVRDVGILNECGFNNGREAGLNTILEIVGGGVACLDFDQDGRCDLVFARGGKIDATAKQVTGLNLNVLRNLGDWQFADCLRATTIDTSRIYAHGVAPADWDHDGFDDVLVYGYNGVEMLHNMGDGTFQSSTISSGLKHSQWTTAVAWLDANSDSMLDVYLGSYVNWNFDTQTVCKSKGGEDDVCSPNVFAGQTNALFLNSGDGNFENARDLLPATQPAKSLGAIAAEFVSGRGTELYVANDLIPNFLFTRRADQWQETAFANGVAVDDDGVANGSMGIALLDFNLDLQSDLFVTNFEHEKMALYLNHGQDGFHYHSRQAGLNRNDLQVVAFGVVAADFDADMDEDVIMNAGHVHYHPDHGAMEQLPAYLQNEAGRTFKKVIPTCGFFTEPTVSRGLATADLDSDGDLDFLSTSLFGAPKIVENKGTADTQWVSLQLVGTNAPRNPIGTRVELTLGSKTIMRQLASGGSYLSHSQSHLNFSWPKTADNSEKVQLTIRWPSGHTSKRQVPVGQHTVLVEGTPLP